MAVIGVRVGFPTGKSNVSKGPPPLFQGHGAGLGRVSWALGPGLHPGSRANSSPGPWFHPDITEGPLLKLKVGAEVLGTFSP